MQTTRLVDLPLTPYATHPESGAVTRTLGPLTIYCQAPLKSTAPWLVMILLNGDYRLGQLVTPVRDVFKMARFSARLWDRHHARWANRRQFVRDRLVGLVRADDEGLDSVGVERWREPVKSRLIVVGG